jgi:hypothetical protein
VDELRRHCSLKHVHQRGRAELHDRNPLHVVLPKAEVLVDAAELPGGPEAHDVTLSAVHGFLQKLIRSVLPVLREGIDADAGPAEVLEGLGVRVDLRIPGPNVDEVAVGHARVHAADDPLVLAQLTVEGLQAERLPQVET